MAEGINSLGGISSDENNTERNKAAASFVSHAFLIHKFRCWNFGWIRIYDNNINMEVTAKS